MASEVIIDQHEQTPGLDTAWSTSERRQAYSHAAGVLYGLQQDKRQLRDEVFIRSVESATSQLEACRHDYATYLEAVYTGVSAKVSGQAWEVTPITDDLTIPEIIAAKARPRALTVLENETATIAAVHLPAWGPRMLIDPEILTRSPDIEIQTKGGETYFLRLSDVEVRKITKDDPEYLEGRWLQLDAESGTEIYMLVADPESEQYADRRSEITGALFVDVAKAWAQNDGVYVKGRLMEGNDEQSLNAPSEMVIVRLGQPGLRHQIMPNSQLPNEQMEQNV